MLKVLGLKVDKIRRRIFSLVHSGAKRSAKIISNVLADDLEVYQIGGMKHKSEYNPLTDINIAVLWRVKIHLTT